MSFNFINSRQEIKKIFNRISNYREDNILYKNVNTIKFILLKIFTQGKAYRVITHLLYDNNINYLRKMYDFL